ncbi:D-alanyl-D-alanine carboxypeptidase family protein [Gracilibacillus sp. S3-1-1]|uniref:D-alanyl-D-alanine carboxypeptidase family protein n=1 Tax=Gracilibacillus pellucidus TaxID=3095368 RepID=A0ACC6M410_9BACI|nr:D-alanyl-D-alanine carboxypeptidase family protein [Gracilibacillus sp. S3-1-1]MDX8045477.1 D-alanyl-D-alanine carboxypeptidase family protein [Gracilibacillus sp. S3-1-1]
MKAVMKKMSLIVVIALLMITTLSINNVTVEGASVDTEAESAIVIDANTGKVLFEKQSDLKLPPASMTKMMTEYLVLEAIDQGHISWDTTIQIDDYPYWLSSNNSFSGIGLIQDKDYTVRELYEGMAIISDNATTVALAELVAGTEGEFVQMMNDKAEEMGLPEYKFVNSTGLENADLGEYHPEGTEPDADNLLSARSAALLAYHLVNDYPEALDYSSTMLSELDDRPLENLNWMLPWDNDNFRQFAYDGVDGLKTGHTKAAGYCFTGTAQQGDRRIITVVMKTDSESKRFIETKKLMNFGFNQFESAELFPANYQLEDESELQVSKGKEKTVGVETAEPFATMVKNGEEDLYSVRYEIDQDKLTDDGTLEAPIEAGEKVGQAILVYDGDEDFGYIDGEDGQRVDLVTTTAVEKANWFMLSLGAIGDFFSNIFSTVVDFFKGLFS